MSETTEKKLQFIGPRQVAEVVPSEFKTFGGKATVTVKYEGGFSEFMPLASFEALVTPEATDFTNLGKRKHRIILEQIMALLAEHDLKGGEVETLVNGLSNELFNAFNKATHLLWTGGDTNTFTPGGNTVLERSLLEAHRVITSFPDKPAEAVEAAK